MHSDPSSRYCPDEAETNKMLKYKLFHVCGCDKITYPNQKATKERKGLIG